MPDIANKQIPNTKTKLKNEKAFSLMSNIIVKEETIISKIANTIIESKNLNIFNPPYNT